MVDSPLIAAVLGAVAGALVALGVLRLWRHLRQPRLGAGRGDYAALHVAAHAAAPLRVAFDESGDRAARQLRQLLGCQTLAIVGSEGELAVGGAAPGRRDMLRELATGPFDDTRPVITELGADGWAVAAPIVIDGADAGAVVALDREKPGELVQAVQDVTELVAVQLQLRSMDASRAALADAQLQALRSQISPHFIYNALNAIAAFIITDPPQARELVLEFADFTRYSLRRAGDFTTVAEELRSIHSYLELERARFGQRLQVTVQVAPETLSAVIPFLSVQPLVENSVRHGLESRPEGGSIRITAEEIGADVIIQVEDDGVGIDPDELEALLVAQSQDGHVGLRNVDARLRRAYGEEYGIVIETNAGSGTLVRIRVPRSQPLHDAGPRGGDGS